MGPTQMKSMMDEEAVSLMNELYYFSLFYNANTHKSVHQPEIESLLVIGVPSIMNLQLLKRHKNLLAWII